MGRTRQKAGDSPSNSTTTAKRKGRPATTPEGRENQMIALAVDLAEQQLRDGTASSQVITHYLKLGSMREKLERQILKQDIELKAAKTEALQSAKQMEDLYINALNAMKSYAYVGSSEIVDDENI